MSLNAKEKHVLGELVRHFIITAAPVSSALIARKSGLKMSSATVRSILAGLERKGYVSQPHTSAGRVPDTPAYRIYVNSLMKKARLSTDEKGSIFDSVQSRDNVYDDVLREVSRILAHLSRQLGIIVTPQIAEGVFQRMELIKIASDKMLIVITIESGFFKTLTLEIDSLIDGERLRMVSQVLNERLQSMRVCDIRERFATIVRDIWNEDGGLYKMFAREAPRLFDFGEAMELYFMGTHHLFQQPDFIDRESFSGMVELLENRRMVVLLQNNAGDNDITIRIGEEISEQCMRNFSIITSRYRIGHVDGTLGVIGPKRMDYSKVVSLVEFAARTITSQHGSN